MHDFRPAVITLDLLLPDASGLALLEQLKRDRMARHIPVHIISVAEEKTRALELGVAPHEKRAGREALAGIFDQLEHSLARSTRRVLIVDGDG